MNPSERKLRLRRITLRSLAPPDSRVARGGAHPPVISGTCEQSEGCGGTDAGCSGTCPDMSVCGCSYENTVCDSCPWTDCTICGCSQNCSQGPTCPGWC